MDAERRATRRRRARETLTAYRTVHGIVYARGTVERQEGRVRRARARPTSTRPTARSASSASTTRPSCTTRSRSARRSTASTSPSTGPTSTPTTSPTSCRAATRSARRAPRRTSRSSAPASTTGRASTPTLHTMKHGAARPARPHAVDQPYLVSWNNKQAPGWAAADDKFSYGPDLPLADDRATASRRAIKGARQDDARAARAGDGGAGDAGHPRARARADRCSRRSASRRDPKLRDAIDAAASVGAPRRAPARPRQGRQVRRRRTRSR